MKAQRKTVLQDPVERHIFHRLEAHVVRRWMVDDKGIVKHYQLGSQSSTNNALTGRHYSLLSLLCLLPLIVTCMSLVARSSDCVSVEG